MATIREVIYKIIGDSKDFQADVAASGKALDDFKKKTKDADEMLSKVAKTSTIAVTAISALGLAATKTAIDFNKGFSQVQTLIPSSTERIKELQKSVLDLSPAVGKTTEDLTTGLYQVISAFGDSADSAKQLELAAKAATAGNASTVNSIDLLSAVTKGYGDTSLTAQQKVSDLAFTAVKLGQTTFPELASSIQRVTSLSNTLGVSQEEMFSVFSSGTGVIGGASEVSTKLAQTYNELLKPQEKLQTAFKALGVTTGNELIQKFGSFSAALDALKGYADATGVPISNLFGSIEAGQLALYTTGAGANKLASDLDEMSRSAGATETAFKAATTGGVNAFGFQIEQSALSVKSFAIKIGQELIPQLNEFLTPLFKTVDGLKDLDEETIKNIISVGKVVVTALAATTAVAGFTKGLLAARAAVLVLNGAIAANPIGAIIAVALTAGVALNEFAKSSENAKNAHIKLLSETEKAKQSLHEESINALKLTKEYEHLTTQENLSASEKQRLKTVSEQLKAMYPELSSVYDKNTGSLKLNRAELEKLNEEKLQAIKRDKAQAQTIATELNSSLLDQKKRLDTLKIEHEKAIKEFAENPYSAKAQSINSEIGIIEKDIKTLEQKVLIYNDAVKSYENALTELTKFNPAQKEVEKTSSSGIEILQKTQGEKLSALKASFEAEKQIYEKRNEDTVILESEYLQKVKKLLDDFNKEDLSKGMTLKVSDESKLAGNDTIEKERENAVNRLSEIEDAAHKKRIEQTKEIAEKTEASIDKEIALKLELGLIDGNTESEIKRNALLEKSNALKEKQKSLITEYNQLIDSGSDKDKERAEALKIEIEKMGKAAANAFNESEKTASAVLEKIKKGFEEAASFIGDTFSSIKNIFSGLISNQAERDAQNYAKKLTDIENEKNTTLLEMDRNIEDLRYEQRKENEAREEAEKEEAYQKKLEEYDRSITDLETSLESETNVKKLKELELKLEAERKKKAEEIQRKKEEEEKKKRDEAQRKAEIELLNKKSEAEYGFAVSQIQVENAAGDAKAKAAQEQAKWEKASTVLSLTLQAAIMTAKAAASFPNVASMVAYSLAAGLAVTQAAVASSAPAPAGYTPQPLPPAPSPIKFASGGIALPQTGGVGFNLPSGRSAVAAEAGVPELILPITTPNIENLFKAAGFNPKGDVPPLVYNPIFSLTFSGGVDANAKNEILEFFRNDAARDLLEIVEDSKRKYMLGESA